MSASLRRLAAASIAVAGLLSYPPLLLADVVIDVNSNLDQIDDDLNDGLCHTASGGPAAGKCTLRAAVMTANRVTGAGATIHLPADTYDLTRPAVADDSGGSLKFTTPSGGSPIIHLIGAGAASTIIDAHQIDRVVQVQAGRTATISGVTLKNGYKSGNGYLVDSGGGITVHGSLTLDDSAIIDSQGEDGGALFLYNASLAMNRCDLHGNSAEGRGGAIHSFQSDWTIDQSTIHGNSAPDGGGVHVNAGTVTISRSTIDSNSARDGGGIYISVGTLNLVNSTVLGNDANDDGGGLWVSGTAVVYSSTIFSNQADADIDKNGGTGGGIYVDASGSGHVINTLIAANYFAGGPNYSDCSGTLHTIGYNLFWNLDGCSLTVDFGSNGLLGSLAAFGALAFNGGPTRTASLLAGNGAINAGDLSNGCFGPNGTLSTDQRGAPRAQGGRCDVGAYEFGELFFDGFEFAGKSHWSAAVP